MSHRWWRSARSVHFPLPKHSYAVKISVDGELLMALNDANENIYALASVHELGKLYLGSLINNAIEMMNVLGAIDGFLVLPSPTVAQSRIFEECNDWFYKT